jgi:FkbM family methyltransferase
MNQVELQLENSEEPNRLDIAAREIAQLRADLDTMLAAHRQFGQLNGDASSAQRLLQKVTRRSLTWYTSSQHALQGSLFRLLRDIAAILERHEIALRETLVAIADMGARLSAAEHRLQQIKTSGRIYQVVQDSGKRDPALGQPAWDVNLSATVTPSDLFHCFRLLLDRTPDQQEWLSQYARVGEDLTQLVTSFLHSQEFVDRHLLDPATGKWELVQLRDFKMYVSLDDDFIGGSIIRTREYEPHLSRIFRQYIRPGMQVLDIGANMGYFSLLAASLVGPHGGVYSWEPSSNNVRMLRASQIVNHFRNIEIVQAAAGAQTGLLHYFPNSSNGTVSAINEAKPEDLAHAETVMALRIDDLIPQNAMIGFVKIDVEGYEYEALRGAQQTICRCRPIIASEFCPSSLRSASGISGEDFLQFLVQLGYDLSVIDGDKLVASQAKDVISHYERSGVDHIDILMRPSDLKG